MYLSLTQVGGVGVGGQTKVLKVLSLNVTLSGIIPKGMSKGGRDTRERYNDPFSKDSKALRKWNGVLGHTVVSIDSGLPKGPK